MNQSGLKFQSICLTPVGAHGCFVSFLKVSICGSFACVHECVLHIELYLLKLKTIL